MHLSHVVREAHTNARQHGFWGSSNNIGEKLMLVVTEVGEAMEVYRRQGVVTEGHCDDFAEEMADVVIRVADLCGWLDLDLEAAVVRKMAANRARPRLHGKAL